MRIPSNQVLNDGSTHLQLSKSRLLSFRQCPLRLWNEINRRELAQPPDAAAQHIFDEGTRIGLLARGRYPGGRLIDAEYWDIQNALSQTLDALNNPSLPATYEAAFLAGETFICADILKRVGLNEWEMWEVKSVVNPKEIHEIDIAIQVEIVNRWALQSNLQFTIKRFGVLHLNKDYIYPGGEYDLQSLFTEYDCTGLINQYRVDIDRLIRDGLITAALADPPDITPGDQCSDPYYCPFSGTTCGLPEVEELSLLPRMTDKKITELKARGIKRIADLSETEASLSSNQRRAVAAWKSGEAVIEQDMKGILDRIGYPRMHLDFETFMPALPRYAGTRPYQTIPFQFSVHIELQPGGDLIHAGYLHNEDTDPRRPLALAMLKVLEAPEADSLRADCPILTYSHYEKRIIGGLAEALPDLRPRLLRLQGRLLDLLPIICCNVYHKDFSGGFSIKNVLPALIPEMSYSDLDIAEGGIASLKYLEMIELRRAGIDSEAADKIYHNLWLYCQRDTMAMVALLKRLGS